MRAAWVGFTDVTLLLNTAFALLLASVLGAVIAFHPASRRSVDTLEEVEAQKVFVLYAAIGAITGAMVLKYGTVVGFVVFGIGGLIRFRTDLQSAPMTGRLILVTLIGLACGLQLAHLAVLATAFGFALIAVLDATATFRIVVKNLGAGSLASAAQAYRSLLEREGCRVLGETKSFAKDQVELVFRAPRRLTRAQLAHELEAEVPDALKGVVDWEVD
ncbi:MAG TPA: hypothetical protein VFW03_19690 [Gemmatimonadaceae bacterium]|nr:hypothetical protein [Gemmatimonadaceae bacterium]